MLSESRSVERIVHLLDEHHAEPRAPHLQIICAGGDPDVATVTLINLLAKSLPIRLRLIWHGWADISTWKNAVALWQWDVDAGMADLERAARFGIRSLVRRTDGNQRIAETLPHLDLYESGRDFVERLYLILGARRHAGAANEHRIFRGFNALRDRRDFHLSAPVVA
jgi:hypothetical protein